jgi:hypothetical protein
VAREWTSKIAKERLRALNAANLEGLGRLRSLGLQRLLLARTA